MFFLLDGGREREKVGAIENTLSLPFPFEIEPGRAPVSGYAENKGSSGVPTGMLIGDGRGLPGVEAPDGVFAWSVVFEGGKYEVEVIDDGK